MDNKRDPRNFQTWDERTRRQRYAETHIGNRGTYAGVVIAIIAVMAFGVAIFRPNLVTNLFSQISTEPASQEAVSELASSEEAPASTETTSQVASTSSNSAKDEAVQAAIDGLTLEQKVAQLFIVTPEELTNTTGNVTLAGETTKACIEKYPVGGIIYSSSNLYDTEQVETLLKNTQGYAGDVVGVPIFLTVEEEGGSSVRATSYLSTASTESAEELGEEGDADATHEETKTIGEYLLSLGFNLDLAPVADLADDNSYLGSRSFGQNPRDVTKQVKAAVEGFWESGILCAAKYFPGTGSSSNNPKYGAISSDATLDDLRASDLLPFESAIDADVPAIVVGHMSFPSITDDDTPASFSEDIVDDLLRYEEDFGGIIITDSLSKEAITDTYKSSEVGVLALQAGCDMILDPLDFEDCYEGILAAVEDGTITEDRIDKSLTRIIGAKYDMNKDLKGNYATAAGEFE